MKFKSLIIIALGFLSVFASCKKAPLTVGKTVTETRSLPDFKEVHLNDNVNITLVRSDNCCIQITTGENIIENISTEVNDGILTISNTTTLNWIRPYGYELHATLYYKNINNFIFASSGTLDTKNQYNAPDYDKYYRFEIHGGSGDVDILVNDCPKFYFVYQQGTSMARIHGENNGSIVLFKRSYGILDARNYEAQKVAVSNHDVGDCYVNAIDTLSAEINHLGNVYYIGNPEYIDCEYGEFAKGKLIKL